MQLTPTEHWNRAQRYEATGTTLQARTEYEAILDMEPLHVPACLRMSRLEQASDRYVQSRAHALRAAQGIRINGGTRHVAYVTSRLLEFAEDSEIASVVASLDWSDPDVVRQSPSLAQHLSLAGKYEDALRFLDAMEARAPGHPLLDFLRANVLRYTGQMEAAERCYEACIAARPELADAHWSLSTHSRARPPLSRVTRIRNVMAKHAPGSQERAQLHYALFHELDAADSPEAAWSELMEGAGVMRSRVSHDLVEETKRLQQLMDAPWQMQGVDSRSEEERAVVPVFIVGMPRTGTTLLDRILGNHPDVHSGGERNDFTAAVSEASGHFFRGALQWDTDRLRAVDWPEAGRLYLQRLRGIADGRRFVIDKNPQNLFNLPLLLHALPHARILCLQRDPMDACFSNLKELFHGGAYPYSYDFGHLAAHCLNVREWMRHWQAAVPDSVRIVDYEALATDPRAQTDAILEFAGLEPAAGIHDITRNTAPVATASSSQVREGIHSRGIGAWKRYERQLQPLRERLEG